MSHLYDEDANASLFVVDTRTERGLRRRHSLGRSLRLTALGTAIPGAGLAFAGRRRTGLALLAAFVVTAAAIVVVAMRRGLVTTALGLAVSDRWLIALSVGVGLVALVWIWSIVATHLATRPMRPGFPAVTAKVFTALMCLVILLPGLKVIQYAAIQRDLVSSMFSGKHGTAAAGSNANPGSGTGAAGTATDPWAGMPRVNVLLLGSDAGADRTGVRTDSMMVASINTKTGNTVLFGLPRNLERVRFPAKDPLSKIWPNGYNCGSVCLLNAVWTEAYAHKDLFKGDSNPGLTATTDTISQTLGLQITNTAVIDLAGFTSLVDAMGGVTVDVTQRIPIGGSHTASGAIAAGSIKGWIEKGRQHLNGYKALWFSRSRATTDDYSRMRRQRCMVSALLTQVNPVSMLGKYPTLAKVAKKNISVDIAAADLPAWVTLVQRIQRGRIASLPFTASNTNVVNPDFAKIRTMVQKAIADSGAPPPPSSATPKKKKASKDAVSDVKDAC